MQNIQRHIKLLLSVDVGVKTGLALYSDQVRLLWYRSHNYGNKQRLKQDAANLINDLPGLSCLVIEGGGEIGALWIKEAARRHIPVIQTYAEEWRNDLFDLRDRRHGWSAKQHAVALAGEIIDRYGDKKVTSLNDDCAEAILIGYWALLRLKWLP
jgi:hypothetical protein